MKRRIILSLLLAAASGVGRVDDALGAAPARMKLGDVELALNGAGGRTKYLMQMYEAGLYLARPSNDAPAVVAADEPMAIRIEVTSGLVTQKKLDESLTEGFASATDGRTELLRDEIAQFRQCFAAPIAKGDVFNIIYLPPHGVIVLKNGQRQGGVAGLAFKQALFGIWLGETPADEDLKVAMLNVRAR